MSYILPCFSAVVERCVVRPVAKLGRDGLGDSVLQADSLLLSMVVGGRDRREQSIINCVHYRNGAERSNCSQPKPVAFSN